VICLQSNLLGSRQEKRKGAAVPSTGCWFVDEVFSYQHASSAFALLFFSLFFFRPPYFDFAFLFQLPTQTQIWW
jgi:hypothetical protein